MSGDNPSSFRHKFKVQKKKISWLAYIGKFVGEGNIQFYATARKVMFMKKISRSGYIRKFIRNDESRERNGKRPQCSYLPGDSFFS